MVTTSLSDVPTRISVEEARARVLALCADRRMPGESVAIGEACGRVLAEGVAAPFDLPPFANSAMDGYALCGDELPKVGEGRFRIAGEMRAGASAFVALARGECVRIMTGAPLPPGADTVVIRENTRREDDAVVIAAGERAGANVRPAGEDYRAGSPALPQGTRLDAAHVGVLAAFGRTTVQVACRPRVALFVTGDELMPPGQPLGFGQIHDSNRYSLAALLQDAGMQPVRQAHLPDAPAAIEAALREAGADCDLIVSSGGVSAGEADFLPAIVAAIGRVHFRKVRMKPGMPLLCGEVGRALVFALPGNPVSTIATFLAFVRPALLALQGAPQARRWTARLAVPLHKRHERAEFQRARLRCEDGMLLVDPVEQQGSAMLRGVAEADVLVHLPEDLSHAAAGSVMEILPLPGKEPR
jgi:molybdopterin molybdotransferase